MGQIFCSVGFLPSTVSTGLIDGMNSLRGFSHLNLRNGVMAASAFIGGFACAFGMGNLDFAKRFVNKNNGEGRQIRGGPLKKNC